MNAMNFVVRTSAGNSEAGQFSADQNVHVIEAGSGQEISLNLRQTDIQGYTRQGRNLEVVLADGRVVVLENYFSADGSAASRLFISADGYINEVTLVDGGDGAVYAQYGPTEQWGKWSPTEDLIFIEGGDLAVASAGEGEVSMLGAGLLGGSGLLGALGLGAAGLGAAAALGGGTGDEGGSKRIEPTINEQGPIVIAGDAVDPETEELTLTGTAEPGSSVVVSVGGITVETEADDDGNWSAGFAGEDFPPDGDHTVTAVATEPDGTVTDLTGPDVAIDTTGPEIVITEGAVSVGEVINAAEYGDGIRIAGEGEPGASLAVTVEGVTHETVVAEDGTWAVTFAPGEVSSGELTTGIEVVSVDGNGNSSTLTDALEIDTIPHDLTIQTETVAGDGVVNLAENSDGFTITGTSAPGAEVIVEFGGITQTVTVNAEGVWEASYSGNQLEGGEYDATVTASTVDAAGNPTTTTGTLRIDTEVQDFSMQSAPGGADGVINAAEHGDGIVVTGTTEPGASVVLELNGQSVTATVAADGSWTAAFTSEQIASGTYTATMTATTTDAAGNIESLSQEVIVDTDAGTLTLDADSIGGDGIINAAEAAAGVAVTGTADPGATVVVTLDGVEHVTQADDAGNWTTTYLEGEITPGTHTPVVTARTTDAAGNSKDVSGTVQIDTEVLDLAQAPYDLAVARDGTDVINNEVAAQGFELTGTVEIGSTVMVTVDGVSRQADVDANGNWTASFAAGALGAGERDLPLTVDVTDPAGNTASLSDTLRLDTLVSDLALDEAPIAGDGIVNAAEAAEGVQINGQVEPGSRVTLELFGKSYVATVSETGAWTVDIPGGDLPVTEVTTDMIISATDNAGNTDTITEALTLDLVAPDQPGIVGTFRQTDGGYRSITTQSTDDAVSVHQVAADGDVSEIALHHSENTLLGETDHFFLDASGSSTTISDGSELVVTNTDAAGNTSSTYVVLDETSTTSVDLGTLGVEGFNIDEIDLGLGDKRELTINEDQLKALSENGDQLIVRGGVDDTVNITGASAAGTTQIDGDSFDIYTLGTDGATIIVDDEINVVT